jgi:hypothetical protein
MITTINAKERVREYAMRHYGNLFSTEEPIFDEKEKLWKAQLKSNYPRLIKNDQPEERFIRVLPLKGLGTICLNEGFQFVENCSSKREDSIDLIRSYLEMWKEQVENIVVSASSKQLANTHPARTFLHPANMILSNFRQKRDAIIKFEALERMRKRRTKIDRWVSLLEDLELIKKIEIGYIYGDIFTKLESKVKSHSEFETLSMAYILEKSYPLLKEIFHIQQFEPLVHMDSCYYRPALEAESALYQTSDSMFKRFIADYGYNPQPELRHMLLELQKSDALWRKNSFYYANEEIFKEMLNLKNQAPALALPHA